MAICRSSHGATRGWGSKPAPRRIPQGLPGYSGALEVGHLIQPPVTQKRMLVVLTLPSKRSKRLCYIGSELSSGLTPGLLLGSFSIWEDHCADDAKGPSSDLFGCAAAFRQLQGLPPDLHPSHGALLRDQPGSLQIV